MAGKYCQKCGQENIEPKETFWHMVTHFFYDITHFDGSFFTTLKDLLFKPGFLSKEYMLGRRKKYLHPIRMYVFTSAVFFLIFFSMFKIKESDIEVLNGQVKNKEKISEIIAEALKNAVTKEDSLAIEKLYLLLGEKDSVPVKKNDEPAPLKGKINSKPVSLDFGSAEKYNSIEEYDSIQKTLSNKKRDGFFMRMLNKKLIGVNSKYKGKEEELLKDIAEKFLHSIPYLLFVSLPLYALFLKLLYVRRKKFFYADHGIFLIHLFVFTFIFLLIYFGLGKLSEATHLGVFNFLRGIFILTGFYYTLRAMKIFYEQGWGKTILKFILFNIACLVTALVLFSVFAISSALLV